MRPNGSSSRFPNTKRLRTGLEAVLGENGAAKGGIRLLRRQPNPYESTFPTEIVTCRMRDGGPLMRLFIKYGTKTFDGVYGHRGDVSYEARVYRDVLQPLRMSTPTFYGLYEEPEARVPWLVIEYLKGGIQTKSSHDPDAMVHAARWIGRFHATTRRLPNATLKFLRKYDDAYYMGWARRTKELFVRQSGRLPWLSPLCDDFETLIPCLLNAPQSVIHGEYFGLNILFQERTSRPTDWQTAAIAPGEIDLASLTHSWPAPVVKRCERGYRKSRWPDGAPGDFEETLRAARFYMNFRWLGDPGLMKPLFGPTGRPVIPKKAKKFIRALLALRRA